jgi:hypothetical protein
MSHLLWTLSHLSHQIKAPKEATKLTTMIRGVGEDYVWHMTGQSHQCKRKIYCPVMATFPWPPGCGSDLSLRIHKGLVSNKAGVVNSPTSHKKVLHVSIPDKFARRVGFVAWPQAAFVTKSINFPTTPTKGMIRNNQAETFRANRIETPILAGRNHADRHYPWIDSLVTNSTVSTPEYKLC